MGNKQQTPRALLELSEESLTTMTTYYNQTCVVAHTESATAALTMFFEEPDSNSSSGGGGGGGGGTESTKESTGETPPHVQARRMLTNTLTSIVSALLGRPISQASNKDRRATDAEKEAIAVILTTGAGMKGKVS